MVFYTKIKLMKSSMWSYRQSGKKSKIIQQKNTNKLQINFTNSKLKLTCVRACVTERMYECVCVCMCVGWRERASERERERERA